MKYRQVPICSNFGLQSSYSVTFGVRAFTAKQQIIGKYYTSCARRLQDVGQDLDSVTSRSLLMMCQQRVIPATPS